ncbi:MAG: AAA family ATPase [Ruminococcus sp.]|jgi:predicted ATP-binding protein involved in virulence|nr:AAA family ATPase [Ruminococcus sp.]
MKIEKLFGRFDYDLNFDNEDGVTILTGPNGFGKTTILNSIDSAVKRNFGFFDDLPYKKIDFIYNNNVMESVTNLNGFHLLEGCNDDVFAGFSGTLLFLSDQRIYDLKTPFKQTISALPNELQETIKQAATKYSEESNKLDGTYTKRLMESADGISEQQYNELTAEAKSKFEKLSKYNLVNLEPFTAAKYDEKYANTLKIYFDDFDKKYSIFADLITKLELFTNIINSRLLFKSVKISPEKGFFAESDKGDELDLAALSSGEKQEIILFFNLIFNADKDTLLLIDEPELSLHVTWQHNFIQDLIDVAKLNSFKAIVATHSPQIIAGRWDLQIDLGEIYNGE